MPDHISLPSSDYAVVGSIVLYHTPAAELARAIEQFLAVPLKKHLCVIDNSPKRTELTVEHRDVSYHFMDCNLGYGRAHNLALRAARGRAQYNLVMNTDVIYKPDAVMALYSLLEQRKQAGLAAPRMLYPDGSLQYVCRMLPTPKNFFLRRFMPGSRWAQRADESYELRFWDHQSLANLPYFQGSYLMLRTELCNGLGGFDERFFMYGEDIDLCRRIYEVAEALYVPQAQVIHEYRRYSQRSWRGTWIGIQNNARYFNKWGWFFDRRRAAINARIRLELEQRAPSEHR